jgi:addiction module HigA family antidote
MMKNGMRPVHPGEILREEFLVPLGLSVHALAMALRVPATRIHDVVKERRAVTSDTALRLARYFGGDARSWLALQAEYDLRKAELVSSVEQEVTPREAAWASHGGLFQRPITGCRCYPHCQPRLSDFRPNRRHRPAWVAGPVQCLSQAAISCRRFSNRSPRR